MSYIAKLKGKLLKLIRRFSHLYIRFIYYRCPDRKSETLFELSIPGKSVFFGYHDLDPSFDNGKKILAHVYNGNSISPEAIKNPIDVGYFVLNDDEWRFEKIASTNAWCWQQGARLQFVNVKNKRLILFNSVDELGEFHCSVFDLDKTKFLAPIKYPINAISRDGTHGATLNFGLLGNLRPGYGYFTQNISQDAYIKIFNLITGQIIHEKIFDEKIAYINHLSFSPDGHKVLYFKFYKDKKEQRKRSLVVVDLKKNREIYELQNVEFSHFVWVNEEQILLSISKILFWRSAILNLNLKKLEFGAYFVNDFHPYLDKSDSNNFFADSYPMNGKRYLYYSNYRTKRIIELMSIDDDSLLVGECRVDLHPRKMAHGNFIHIDSAENGYRKSKVLELK